MGSLRLLGLEEGTTADQEHVVRRGAYLSLLFLRHLRLRELKVKKLNIKSAEIRVNFFKKGAVMQLKMQLCVCSGSFQRLCLGILNYFRSMERSLTISTSGLSFKAGHLIPSAEDTSWVSAAKGGTGAFGGLGSQPYVHYTPADYKVRYHPAFCLPKCVLQQEYLIQFSLPCKLCWDQLLNRLRDSV